MDDSKVAADQKAPRKRQRAAATGAPAASRAQLTPTPKPSKFGRFMDKLRGAIIRVRRAGVPHEATVVIPASVNYLTFRAYEGSSWHIAYPALTCALAVFVCGAWLGLAWRGFPVFSLLLRPLYIAVLTVLLIVLLHHEPVTKAEALRTTAAVFAGFGPFFYNGYLYAALVRDVALRRFGSEKQRQRYYARQAQLQRGKAWLRYIHRLALDRADKSAASDFELTVAQFVKNAMRPETVYGLIAGAGMLFVAVWWGATAVSTWFAHGQG